MSNLNELPNLSVEDAAIFLGLSAKTLNTWRTRGGGPPFARLGARVIYPRKALEAFISERMHSTTSLPLKEAKQNG